MTLVTTGQGKVRFNPNLYANGKVCLSLLGTWSGHGGETWGPSSTLLQVFASIQSLIMTEYVYYNEPGYEGKLGTPEGEARNQGYTNIVRYASVKYAILEQLLHPPPLFARVIRRHFYTKREELVAQLRSWTEPEALAAPARYDDLVASHNASLASKFAADPSHYAEALKAVVSLALAQLGKLEAPDEDEPETESSSEEEDEEEEDA